MKKLLTALLAGVLAVVGLFTFTACQAKDVRIAVQKGTTSLFYAECLKGTETVSYDTFALAAKDMLNGNVDYVFVDKTTAKSLKKDISGLKIVDIALSTEYYGIGIDKNQPELNTQINAILESKAAEIQAIKDKYMAGDEDNYVGVTSAVKDVNNNEGQLVVATNAEFDPWEYKEKNQYFGIDIEIAKLIADELNLELVIEDMDFDLVVGSVGKHGVDIAMSGITITAERAAAINFSNPYYVESIVVVCKEGDTTFDSVGTVVDVLSIICKNK